MSDNWGHYMATMEGHSASVVFDEGIAQSLKSRPENTAYLITAPLRETNEDGMTTDAEAERLETLLDELEKFFAPDGGYFVGRVTSNGVRHHFFYTANKSDEMSKSIRAVGQNLGYELTGGARHDPEKEDYFDHLYPDAESRQVMIDMQVIQQLLEHGDDIHAPRLVDHLSIFPSKNAAEDYADWAKQAGYELDPIRKEGSLFKKRFFVESHNVTAVGVYDINPHSLGHFRKALELGGTYDGWGCMIVPRSTE
jgi:hypothetical protein